MLDTTAPRAQGPRHGPGLALLTIALLGACGAPAEDQSRIERSARFGVFRDLVLFQRPASEGGPFFLDRFESTVADFAEYRRRGLGPRPATAAKSIPDTRPQTRVSLNLARRFAAWRFCRVPNASQWMYACTQGGAYNLPWGDRFEQPWANTGGLGFHELTRVGSFEGGRSPDGPYDLVGNVAEWTETVRVPVRVVHNPDPDPVDEVPGVDVLRRTSGLSMWLRPWSPAPIHWLVMTEARPGSDIVAWAAAMRARVGFEDDMRRDSSLEMPGVDALRETAGLSMWLQPWCPAPTDWLVMAKSDDLPREILGGSFRSTIIQRQPELPLPEIGEPAFHDTKTGVRVATTPRELLVALLRYRGEATELDRAALRRFLQVPGHLRVLADAWPRALERITADEVPAADVLRPLLAGLLGT